VLTRGHHDLFVCGLDCCLLFESFGPISSSTRRSWSELKSHLGTAEIPTDVSPTETSAHLITIQSTKLSGAIATPCSGLETLAKTFLHPKDTMTSVRPNATTVAEHLSGKTDAWHGKITADGPFPPEAGRYHMYIGRCFLRRVGSEGIAQC